MYDPRREARRQLARLPLPDDVQAGELDQDVRRDLQSLSKETADVVARHLVMTGRLIDDEPEQALAHARAAGALAGRVALVREAVGLAAYAAGEWADALSELRAARRMSGSAEHLPVLADCERALGRPERALAAYDDPSVASLDQAVRVELVLVVAGARRDLGQQDAAVLLLQGPARATTAKRPWAVRLWYGYADALLDAGRADEAKEWFAKAAGLDEAGATDAAERLLALEGVVFDSDDDDGEVGGQDDQGLDAGSLDELVAGITPLSTSAAEPATAASAGDGPSESAPDAPTRPVESAPDARTSAPVAEPTVPGGFSSPFSDRLPAAPVPPRPAAVPVVAFVAATEDDDAPEQDETHDG